MDEFLYIARLIHNRNMQFPILFELRQCRCANSCEFSIANCLQAHHKKSEALAVKCCRKRFSAAAH